MNGHSNSPDPEQGLLVILEKNRTILSRKMISYINESLEF